MNSLHSFRTENKLRSHEQVCKDFCGIVMPSEKDKILEFNQYMKSDKMPCANNPENSSTTKIGSIFLEDIQCKQFGHLIT